METYEYEGMSSLKGNFVLLKVYEYFNLWQHKTGYRECFYHGVDPDNLRPDMYFDAKTGRGRQLNHG